MKKAIVLFAAAALAAAESFAFSRMDAGAGNAPWLYEVAISKAAAADPAWLSVANALAAKYSKPPFRSTIAIISDFKDAARRLGKDSPRYVAFVLKPEEAGAKTVFALHALMKSLDGDPYYDAVWGIVTGPTANDAMRVAKASPVHPRRALGTTGFDMRPFDAATIVSDGYAPGSKKEDYGRPDKPLAVHEKRSAASKAKTRIVRGDSTMEFADAWRTLDPELLVTSAHASQRNLEMPFSAGNIVPRKGRLCTLPGKHLIDYSTGQAKKGARAHAAGQPLAAPKRDKIWIAAGNCLIGDYIDNDSMAAAMIGYGRVVQFMGYVKTTWFGEIGWETLAQFMERGATAAEAWYFAGQNLERKLAAMDTRRRDMTLAGRVWDRDGTAFWGDPALDARLEDKRAKPKARLSARRTKAGIALEFAALENIAGGEDKIGEVHVVHPFGVILPRANAPYRVLDAKGLGILAADDFALVHSWPDMKAGEKKTVIIVSPLQFGEPEAVTSRP